MKIELNKQLMLATTNTFGFQRQNYGITAEYLYKSLKL